MNGEKQMALWLYEPLQILNNPKDTKEIMTTAEILS